MVFVFCIFNGSNHEESKINGIYKVNRINRGGVIATDVFAVTGGGGTLGWDQPIQVLVDAITGTFAFGVATVAMVLSLATLSFGGELGAVGRSLIFLILVISLLVNIVNTMQVLFGTGVVLSGASGVGIAALSLLSFSYITSVTLDYISSKVVLSNRVRRTQ